MAEGVNGTRFGHFLLTKQKVTKPRTEALLRVTIQDLKSPSLEPNGSKVKDMGQHVYVHTNLSCDATQTNHK